MSTHFTQKESTDKVVDAGERLTVSISFRHDNQQLCIDVILEGAGTLAKSGKITNNKSLSRRVQDISTCLLQVLESAFMSDKLTV